VDCSIDQLEPFQPSDSSAGNAPAGVLKGADRDAGRSAPPTELSHPT
jgi:hypothetical protein